jgi:hypothetical protein
VHRRKLIFAVGTLVASVIASLLVLTGGLPAASAEVGRPAAASSAPTADQLLAVAKGCSNKLTKKPLQTDEDAKADVNVCGLNGADYFKADMDVDCDGQTTDQCNKDTDCCYQDDTTFHQSDGKALNAAQLPYIVLPRSGSNWDWTKQGINGGSVVAVIYQGKVTYAVFGDTDSPNKAGEASYATAKSLGIDPDPRSGGVDSGVTYIIFSNAKANPIESHDSAVSVGQQAAQQFIANNGGTTTSPTTSPTSTTSPTTSPSSPPVTGPTAAQLLAKAQGCNDKLTKKPLQTDEDTSRNVNVCGLNGAAYFNADMDIDCDGQKSDQCNEDTDCCYQDDTAFEQSDGKALNAAKLPYIVLPESGSNWNWEDGGIDGGSVVAVIYQGKVTYAVVGDTDSPSKVGEASYATAKSLGIDPDPKTGGVDSGVTYIVFTNAKANPIESHDSAVSVGQQAAQQFIAAN